MRSANWCFNVPFFRKQAKRFWPLWSLYTLLYVMLLPMYMLMQAQARFSGPESLSDKFQTYLASMATFGSLWINLFFCIFVAMALWSYLYNNRSVSMIHALPLTRGTLFFTNYVAGLLFSIAPSLIVFVLALGVQAFVGALTIPVLCTWLLCQILFTIFFFSFATLLAFVTGHILALPFFYGIFSVLTKGLTMLLDGVFSSFVYGYTPRSFTALDWFGNWLSPLYALQLKVRPVRPYISEELATRTPMEVSGLGVLAVYAAVGLGMALLAYLLYRRRSLELSGEVITVSYLKPVFKFGVALCSGLAFGMMFYQLFQQFFSRGIWSLLFFLLLWAAIGYYAAEMLLRKSFRVFRAGAPGLVALLLLMTAAMLAMEYDITGYEKSLPDAQKVQMIQVLGWQDSKLSNVEDISGAIALHETLIQQKADIERQNDEYNRNLNSDYYKDHALYSVELRYTLQDGSIFQRQYSLPLSLEALEQKDSPAKQLDALVNRPAVRLESIFPPAYKTENLMEISMNVPDYAKQAPASSQVPGVRFESDPYGQDAKLILSGEAAQMFYAAVREDISAGRLGYMFFGTFQPEFKKINCINGIYFTFRQDYNKTNSVDGMEPSDPYGRYRETKDENGKRISYYEKNLDLQITASSTIAVLEQFGLRQGVHFMTVEQAEQSGFLGDPNYYEKYGYQ